MKIAIIGAGFSGLAICWHLLEKKETFDVTLFDKNGIGGGASGISAGLLHPYAGIHAKYNWMGHEGMKATSKLIQVAETALQEEIAEKKGVLRIALSREQFDDYQIAANKYSDIEWWSPKKCQSLIADLGDYPGIKINHGMNVDGTKYLQGLWKACQAKGAKLEKTQIDDLSELFQYDTIFIAAGMQTKSFAELSHLKIRPTKGQLLQMAWPDHLAPLPLPLNSQAYLVMHPNQKVCTLGATFERIFSSESPDQESACADILPKGLALFHPLKEMEIIKCLAGIRAWTPSQLPIFGHTGNHKIWYLTGMGSKGLLYHALMAEKLVEEFLSCLQYK